MDPITLKKLLSVADELVENVSASTLSLPTFEKLVSKHSRAKNIRRRAQEIFRVLEDLQWLIKENQDLCVTPFFREFVVHWDKGDLRGIGKSLARYPPYRDFLVSLRKQGAISIAADAGGGKKEYVALDTFRFWAVPAAQGYLSPFDENLYWGSEWNEDSPALKTLVASMREGYQAAQKTGGFADLGRVADYVCRQLQIAFQAFEKRMEEVLKSRYRGFVLAPATIRAPSRRFEIATIRSRSEILRERRSAWLNDRNSTAPTRWLEIRYIEDGLRINGQLMKLIKWEVPRDSEK